MKAVYAICHVKPEAVAQFLQLAAELEQASAKDKGVIFYRCGKLDGSTSTYVFIEQWKSMADLELHMQQPHFTTNIPKIQELVSSPLEVNIVDIQ